LKEKTKAQNLRGVRPDRVGVDAGHGGKSTEVTEKRRREKEREKGKEKEREKGKEKEREKLTQRRRGRGEEEPKTQAKKTEPGAPGGEEGRRCPIVGAHLSLRTAKD